MYDTGEPFAIPFSHVSLTGKGFLVLFLNVVPVMNHPIAVLSPVYPVLGHLCPH